MTPRTLAVRLLGRFEVRVDGVVIADEAWRRSRAAAVVKVLALALAPGHRLPREVVMDALWPHLAADAAAAGAQPTALRVPARNA